MADCALAGRPEAPIRVVHKKIARDSLCDSINEPRKETRGVNTLLNDFETTSK